MAIASADGDLYEAFSSWSASIGCPAADPDLFRRLARGNGARFVRLLVQYVQPTETVDRVRSALQLHGVQQPISDQERSSDRRHHDKLAFIRRSHAATIQEIDYLAGKQSQMQRSIRDLSAAAVVLSDACRRMRREHLAPIERIAESIRAVDDEQRDDDDDGSRRIVSLDDSGRLTAADPIRSVLQALYAQLVDDHSRTPTDALPFAPNAAVVDDLVRIAQQRLAQLAAYRNDAESSSSRGADDVAIPAPNSLGQLMQESRDRHIERFFDALDKLNLGGEIGARRRREAPGAEPLLRQVGLRARLDCLQRHIQRCDDELAAAQAEYDRLHGALDAVAKLESERERLHQQLATMIKANRDLRSSLALKQAQCRRNQAVLESAAAAMNERVARLGRCFEIEAGALLLRRSASRSESSSWRSVGRCLGLHDAQVCDPVAILIAIRSRFETLSSLQMSSMVGEPLLTIARQIDSGDIEGLTDRCNELHSNAERSMLDLLAMVKTLEGLDADCASYRELMKQWWEQPAQYTVPDEQRFGLNISGWIERRRKLIAELRPDACRPAPLTSSP